MSDSTSERYRMDDNEFMRKVLEISSSGLTGDQLSEAYSKLANCELSNKSREYLERKISLARPRPQRPYHSEY